MKTLTAQQSALFKLQLWHLRRQKEFERSIRHLENQFAGPIPHGWLNAGSAYHDAYHDALKLDIRSSRRRAALHRKFVNAITPFVIP